MNQLIALRRMLRAFFRDELLRERVDELILLGLVERLPRIAGVRTSSPILRLTALGEEIYFADGQSLDEQIAEWRKLSALIGTVPLAA
jgi:hypothetical protein